MVRSTSFRTFVIVDEIEWIEADSYYSHLHVGPKRYMLRETIKHLISTLNPKTFVRMHRSAMVNINYVREILRDGRNENWVVLASG